MRLRPRLTRSQRAFLRLVFFLTTSLVVLEALFLFFRHIPVQRVSPDSAAAASIRPRIFLASTHRNSALLLRSHWSAAVIDLARHFGPENLYVSIYESGSWDDTKDALGELDTALEELGVLKTITLDERDQMAFVEDHPAETKPGWIWTSRRMNELRRIPFLANLRNEVMKPLYTQQKAGREYDIVLWLNDVVFTTEDILTLLATRGGHYDSVCAQDFMIPSIYYDTFALRDMSGRKAIPQSWPYFLSSTSRRAVLHNDAVPVQSCWNGAIIMKASPFYASPPLRFRGVSDELARYHLEGSECCLIHADNHRGGEKEGVWMNPNVRVGYRPDAYYAVNPTRGVWPSRSARVKGIWENRLARWFAWPKLAMEERVVRKRLQVWEEEGVKNGKKNFEQAHCIINEMQVLVEGGWKHV